MFNLHKFVHLEICLLWILNFIVSDQMDYGVISIFLNLLRFVFASQDVVYLEKLQCTVE